MKKEKAITLIALIVTIIVLLILAGVSITMLSGENGILSKAKYAKESSDKAGIEEENKIGQYNESIDNYTTSRSTTSSGLGEKIKLWDGDLIQVSQAITLSDSIENYKYLLIKCRWSDTTSRQIELMDVEDIVNTGYYTSPSNVNSHILFSLHDVYYIYLSFTSNKTVLIPAKNSDYVHLVGIYGIK